MARHPRLIREANKTQGYMRVCESRPLTENRNRMFIDAKSMADPIRAIVLTRDRCLA